LKEHTLFFLPNTLEQDFDHIADQLDMIILTGGDDSTLRRTVETKIAAAVMQRNRPVVGICHGAFLLTDLLGGQIQDATAHQDTSHCVYYFGEEKTVNSYHNLCITTPHKTATVLATDPEGNCEAWIDHKLAGIVWHPERMGSPWIPDEIENLFK
jgi:gamma-glutamyl-gamma-aminobutyrate hydrolase PuuD